MLQKLQEYYICDTLNPFKIILALLRAFLLIILMIIFMLSYVIFTIFMIFHNEKRAFRLRKLYVSLASAILGIKMDQIEGDITTNGALYVCNHRSFSDPLVLTKYLNAYVIAKAEVGSMPVLSQGAKLTGVIFVKRDSTDSRKATRELMVNTILAGHNVLVYPEGTTNGEKTTKEYRPGTFIEAVKNKIKVVPIVLEYKNEESLWVNRGLFSQFIRQMGCWTTHVKLAVGPTMEGTDGLQLRDEVQEWTNEKIEALHEDWNSVFSA